MARWNLLMAAMAVAAGTIGCAHCDTCDDFPTPCVGANCNGAPLAYAGPVAGMPAGDTVNPPAPSEFGPFGSRGDSSGGPNAPAAPVPSNPSPPGDPGLLPPSDSPPDRPAAPGI